MALDVETVLQAQGAELVLAYLPGQVAACLVGELGDALIDDALVVFVVLVHGWTLDLGVRRGVFVVRCIVSLSFSFKKTF